SFQASSRIVPPDSLLKFGYTPNGAIEFDSATALLSFSYSGSPKIDIGAFGMATRDGEGIVVGHSSQVAMGGVTAEFQVLGSAAADSSVASVAYATADTVGSSPALRLIKSTGSTVGVVSDALVVDDEVLGHITAYGSDGVDLDTEVAQIRFVVQDASPEIGHIGGSVEFWPSNRGASGAPTHVATISSNGVGLAPGNPLMFDGTEADGHTYLWEASDDDVQIVVGGTVMAEFDQDASAVMFNNSNVYIGDTANADMSAGLTINQGANDDQAFAIKSSDIAHGMTSRAETDTYFEIKKNVGTTGAATLNSFGEAERAFVMNAAATNGNTTKTGSAYAPILLAANKKSGTSIQKLGANENMMVLRDGITGGDVRFIWDVEGDFFADGGTSSTTMVTKFDDFADAELVRAVDIARKGRGLVRSEFDDHLKYNEETLIELGIIGAPIADGGLTNVTRLQQLHNGAIWQQHTAHMSLVERVNDLENIKLTALEAENAELRQEIKAIAEAN
ncbi:MAG: hypothetical protein V3T49_01670, partial [Dehalococcoidia bacterium]